MKIENIEKKDRDALRKIFQSVSTHPDRSEAEWKLAWLKYLDYYPEYACDTSLKAVDEDGTIFGYIVCSDNQEEFYSRMMKEFIPQMETMDPGAKKWFEESQSLYNENSKKYPAQIHVDVLQEYQNHHAGTKLLKALIQLLKEKNVKGIMLGVDSFREQAVHFYKKNGFEIIDTLRDEDNNPLCYTMALDLTK